MERPGKRSGSEEDPERRGAKRAKKEKKRKKEMKEKKEKKKKKAAREARGEDVGEPPKTLVSLDDYFAKSREFRLWLSQSKGRTLESYSSEEARQVFEKKFMKAWNRGQLDASFYSGAFSRDELDQGLKTQHRWDFRMSEHERDSLDVLAGKVQRSTDRPEGAEAGAPVPSRPGGGWADGRPSSGRMATGREYRERQKEHLREVVPKESGFEARLQKRREKGAAMRASARDKEANADGEVAEAVLMGGGGGEDGFLQRKLQRIRERDSTRADARREKLQRHEAAEAERMAALRASLGVQPGQKLSIRPRSGQ